VESEGKWRGPNDLSISIGPDLSEQSIPFPGPVPDINPQFLIFGFGPGTENLKDNTTKNKCDNATIRNFEVRR
jgi:hypothetical protein